MELGQTKLFCEVAFEYEQADLSGSAFLSDNSGAVRLVILKKNDFGRLGEVGQHDKNVLAIRGLFCLLATFPLWRASSLQEPSENALLRSKV